MTLGEYLKAPRGPWDWQTQDCCRWVDRWVQECGHASPITALELTYDSERTALRTIARGGGLVALWSRGMDLVGITEADDARLGDVGIIERGDTQVAAIFTGERWASLGLNGLDFGPADVLALWRP